MYGSHCPKTVLVVSIFLAGVSMNNSRAAIMSLDPTGQIHIPIGIANTLDPLKTFVEAEGVFSPGVASYGVYFWTYSKDGNRLVAPTETPCSRGLNGTGSLIPWVEWTGEDIKHRLDICEVERDIDGTPGYVVGVRLQLTNTTGVGRDLAVFAAIRPQGPAGWPIRSISVSPENDALLVEDHPALLSAQATSSAGVSATDNIGELASLNTLPAQLQAASDGTCSGALKFDLSCGAGETKTLEFICPVIPGRRAVGHDWDGGTGWDQKDRSVFNPATGGLLQPDPGLAFYRELSTAQLFDQAETYWKNLAGKQTIVTPDERWAECYSAIVGHAAISMNQGAADVSVVNYNVFNRDGVYTANILQKSGNFELAAKAIDYFLRHPFNGRGYPEADNPGQVLWIVGQQWRFTGDKQWLESVYASVQKLVAMIRYYRTTTEPYYVCLSSIDFGSNATCSDKAEFINGRCDGSNPIYTEAFDLAGVREAVMVAKALNNSADATSWQQFADSLFDAYDQRYSSLTSGYGSYSVLWPCRLYPFTEGKAYQQFSATGAQSTGEWRYFPLATAHQGLYAGNRSAGHQTIANHLEHEQMKGWYAFDEGGGSWQGDWPSLLTTWNADCAMPHGWANAEMTLLLRDCLAFEYDDRLVLMAGLSPQWFQGPAPVQVHDLHTWYGMLTYDYVCFQGHAELRLGPIAQPPQGYVLRVPSSLGASVSIGGNDVQPVRSFNDNVDFEIPLGTATVVVSSSQITGNGAVGTLNRPATATSGFPIQVNAAKGVLSIHVSGEGDHQVRIADLRGRTVFARSGNGRREYRIGTADALGAGSYVARAAQGGKTMSRIVTIP